MAIHLSIAMPVYEEGCLIAESIRRVTARGGPSLIAVASRASAS